MPGAALVIAPRPPGGYRCIGIAVASLARESMTYADTSTPEPDITSSRASPHPGPGRPARLAKGSRSRISSPGSRSRL